MGIAIKLAFPDQCRTEHRLYRALGKACVICVPDPYSRYCLWEPEYQRWYPLAWMSDGSYWDYENQYAVNEHGDKVVIPAMTGKGFRGFGPGVEIITEELPEDIWAILQEAQKVGSPPGEFKRLWFEYEDSKQLMDS